MKHLTDNFEYKEFRPKSEDESWLPTTLIMDYMIRVMAISLENVRASTWDRPIIITSGVRTADDYNRLKMKGYNPSPFSDHNYGEPIPAGTTKRIITGPYFYMTTGAADWFQKDVDMEKVFKTVVDLNKANGHKMFGQVILEKNPKTGFMWIHTSNHPLKIWNPNLCNLIKKPQYLISEDNGKSYKEYK